MYTGLCTNTHTHNLSKHTYSPENNYCMRIGGKQTHTHTQAETLSRMQENNNCV